MEEEIATEKTEEVEEEAESSSSGTKEGLLREMNLIMILSFLSLSAEELLNFKDTETEEGLKQKNGHGGRKQAAERSRRAKKVSKQPKEIEQQIPRFHQSKIRDCRHCRRM